MIIQQFLSGFDDDLKGKITVERFFTPNGRDEWVAFKVGRKPFKARIWNTFAYFYGKRPTSYNDYILSYEIQGENEKNGFIVIEAFKHKKITENDLKILSKENKVK